MLGRRWLANTLMVALAALPATASYAAAQAASTILHIDSETGEVVPAPRPQISFNRGLRASSAVPASTTAVNDTFIVSSHRWDRQDASCQLSGWTGEDLSGRTYAHVSSRFVVDTTGIVAIHMGTKALWFGADSVSAPEEVNNWPYNFGFGNSWSQRLVSPTFSLAAHPRATLSFDARTAFQSTGGVVKKFFANEFVATQALKSDGTWAFLVSRFISVNAAGVTDTSRCVAGVGSFKVVVHFDSLGNNALGLAEPTRVRIVCQTNPSVSQEDGRLVPIPFGAAVVDNVTLREDAIDLAPSLDFESLVDPLGTWTLAAQNGGVHSTLTNRTRDINAATNVTVRSGFDVADPSCVYTFTTAGDSIPMGAHTRISSPWIPIDGPFFIDWGGKLGYALAGRHTQFQVRLKNVGESRPHTVGTCLFTQTMGSTELGDLGVGLIEETILRYPEDGFNSGPGGTTGDSVQIVLFVFDQLERFGHLGSRFATRLPYFSHISVRELSADGDGDGVPNARDGCPAVDASGRDADGNGCADPTATLRHVESWQLADRPIHWRMSVNGDPAISDGSDTTAVRNAFATWSSVPGAALTLLEDPATNQTEASALDGIGLVTFEDGFAFPPNVLAITPTTSYTRRGAFYDRIVVPGQIVDGDVIFNPNSSFRTATHSGGAFDLQSIATHEIGHMLGLSHSPVEDATMFPVLLPGTQASTLEDDDRAAIHAAYPTAYPLAGYGSISGTVTRGGTGAPLAGAAVVAVRLDGGNAPSDSAASDFTDELGHYMLTRLTPANYSIRILPLDGSVAGMVPEAINARVRAIAETNFQAEWYGGPESATDDANIIAAIPVAPGGHQGGIDLVTNIDVVPPTVSQVAPAPLANNIPIDTAILIDFSEPVADTTIGKAFKLHVTGGTGTLGGRGQVLPPGTSFVFTPTEALAFGTDYELQFTTLLTDRAGVPLASTYTTTFQTETRPTIAITDVQPRQTSPGSWLTIRGVGFSPGGYQRVLFSQSGASDSVVASQVTPSSLVARVPAGAVTGPIRVVGGGPELSNTFGITLLPVVARTAPAASGAPVSLGFAPVDVVLSPEGTSAIAVGDSGYATISLCSCRPPFRTAVFHSLPRARHAALSPDGRRLYITRPDSAEVVEVVADTSSGSYGQVSARISVPGTPDGIFAVGDRVYVSDALQDQVHEIDTNPSSQTYRKTIGRRTIPGAAFTGGLAIDPTAKRLLATTRNLGLIAIELSRDSVYVPLDPAPTGAAVAATPGGTEVIACPDVTIGSPPLSFASLPAGARAGAISLGGRPSDLVIDPRGQSVFVINEAFSRLQVLDVSDSTGAAYHRVVAETGTGRSPIAIAISGSGDLLAVANHGESNLNLYTMGGTLQLTRATPPVAAPGDAIALSIMGADPAAGSAVDFGAGNAAILEASSPDSGSAAVRIPSLDQHDGFVSLAIPPDRRTLALPFRIVDAITGLAPRSTGLVATTLRVPCAADSQTAGLERLRTSPDGRLLAVFKQAVAPPACGVVIDLVDATVDAQGRFAHRLGSVATSFSSTIDAQFSSDGHQLWVLIDPAVAAEIRVMDTDFASATFGQFSLTIPLTSLPADARLAADPAGRCMVLTSSTGQTTRYRLDGTVLDAAPVPGGNAIVASPDGRWIIAANGGAASVLRSQARSFALAATTPSHPGSIDRLVTPADARSVFAHYSSGSVAVWNLDAEVGPIGAELAFGSPLPPGFVPGDWLPAPDGHGVLSGSAATTVLYRIDVDSGVLSATTASLGVPSARMSRSADGRLLWVGPISDQVRGYSLSEADRLAFVSGPDQEALAGSALALPVRVKIVSSSGRPQAGVVVMFTLADTAQGRLGGVLATGQLLRVTDALGEAACDWTMPHSTATVTLQVSALGVGAGSAWVTARSTQSDATAVPVVLETGPSANATGIDVATPLFVRFSQRMNIARLAQMNLRVTVGVVFIDCAIDSLEDGRVAMLRPRVTLPFASVCSLSVLSGAVDREGQALANSMSVGFTTQSQSLLSLGALSPPAGPPGASVVIQGLGFSSVAAQNTILLNGTLVPAQSASPTALVIRIPTGAVTGELTVQVGTATSNALRLVVLPENPQPLRVYDSAPAGQGVRDLCVAPGGRRAYATNPSSNSVTAFRLVPAGTLAIIPVGLEPQSIALLPAGNRAYIANRGGKTVSVIDIDSLSATYHRVVSTVGVGDHPVDLAVSATGPSVLVVNQGDSTVSIIDANPAHATYDEVTKVVKTGAGGTQVVVSPDGGTAYIAAPAGVEVLDLTSNAITATIKTGSGGTHVTVSPDGTLLFVLTDDGTISVVDIAPGSSAYNKIVAKVKTGSGGTHVVVSPDGTSLFVTLRDLGLLVGFVINRNNQSGASSTVPGAAVTLTPQFSIPVGQAPAGVAFSPDGSFGLVANEGSGTIDVLSSLTPSVRVDLDLDTFDLSGNGQWVTAYLESGAPFTAGEFVLASVRLNGTVAAEGALPGVLGDHDADLVPDLAVRIRRSSLPAAISTGTAVPVAVTGTIGLLAYSAADTVAVRRGITASPRAGQEAQPNAPLMVLYSILSPAASRAALLLSLDHGATWSTVLPNETNDGSIAWTTPNATADSIRIAVVEVEQDMGGGTVRGVWSESGDFFLHGVTAVDGTLPLTLALSPASPNPGVRATTLRFGLPARGDVRLELFDIAGRHVRTLAQGIRAAGWHEASWGGLSDEGTPVGAGVYFARLSVAGRTLRQRLVWLR